MENNISTRRVVITGIGVISPCGEGREALWSAALESRSSLTPLPAGDFASLSIRVAGIVRDFEASKYISNRKSLKVMCRDIQMAVAASTLAWRDSGLTDADRVPERSGVSIGAGLFNNEISELAESFRVSADGDGNFDSRSFGQSGMAQLFPLWLLKYLPNMPACHITITHSLRGPSNTVTTDSASSASAFEEAYRIIRRGSADLMFCGGAESKLNPLGLLRYQAAGTLASARAEAGYPVFTDRAAGVVPAEGASILILEELEHARRRKARIYAEVTGAFSCVNTDRARKASPGDSRVFAMSNALGEAGIGPDGLDGVHLNANGIAEDDRREASAVKEMFARYTRKPLLAAMKGITGYLGYAAAATEIAIAAMSLGEKRFAPSLVSGKTLLNDSFSFSSKTSSSARPGTVLVNHFASGLSNHCIVLANRGDLS